MSVVRSQKMKLGTLLVVGGAVTTGLAAEVGCSSGSQSPRDHAAAGSTSDGSTGSVGFSLSLPDGSNVDSVTWTLRDSGGRVVAIPDTPNPATVATNEGPTISFLIGGVPSGTNDSLTITATTTNGGVCQGSASGINVVSHTTEKVLVPVVCSASGPDAGNLSVTGTVNSCGTWTGLSTTTSEVFVGESLTLTATATGPDPNNLGYTWSLSAEAGVIGLLGTSQDEAAGPSDANSFMCTAPGTTTITVVVDDGANSSNGSCAANLTTVSTQVTCDAFPANQVESAWVELGPSGNAVARVLTAANCPSITINGAAPQAMSLRVAAAAEPLRTTTSTALGPQFTKPSVFPVNTCEFALPPGTTSAVVAGNTLALPKANPTKMIVIGDTGCRMKAAIPASGDQFQGCNDPTQYPFQQLANLAASLQPDVVLHVGDYQYRENECPPDQANCAGSPWGYGWDTWEADFFRPAANLLAAAPWIVVRGNHEQCTRAGQGWYRFLDPNPYTEAHSCNSAANDAVLQTSGPLAGQLVGGAYNAPYAVTVGANSQVIVFDSNNVGSATVAAGGSSNFNTYQAEFQAAAAFATNPNMFNIWTNHHPLLGFAPNAGAPPSTGNLDLLSVMVATYPNTLFPPNINLALHGHTHLFEAIDFTSTNYPATIVTGNAGTLLDIALPDPFPTTLATGGDPVGAALDPAGNVEASTIADAAGFGFLFMQYTGTVWTITEYRLDGSIRTVCTAQVNGQMTCTANGFLP
jgi:hypothetical protein